MVTFVYETKFARVENGILHNGHQPPSVVNGFIDQGKVMKMLSIRGALCCDKHQCCAKVTVST